MNQFRELVEHPSLIDVSDPIFALADNPGDEKGLFAPLEYYKQLADLLADLSTGNNRFRRSEMVILLQKNDVLAIRRYTRQKKARR